MCVRKPTKSRLSPVGEEKVYDDVQWFNVHLKADYKPA